LSNDVLIEVTFVVQNERYLSLSVNIECRLKQSITVKIIGCSLTGSY